MASYNADGTLAWARSASGVLSNGAAALADGSVAVTGNFGGTKTFGPGEANATSLTSDGSNDVFLFRIFPYDP